MARSFDTTVTLELTKAISIEMTGTFHPYQPAYTPRGEYAPIDPPEPALFEPSQSWFVANAVDGARIGNRLAHHWTPVLGEHGK